MVVRTYDNPLVTWSDPQAPLPSGGGVFPFTICTTTERLKLMLSVLYWGGPDQGLGFIDDHNVDVIAALSEQPPACFYESNPDPGVLLELIDDLRAMIAGDTRVCGIEDNCEDDEMRNLIIKIGGKAYLANNCNCGDTELYPLDGPIAASLDADGNTEIATEAANPVAGWTESKAEYKECVAASFIPFVASRITDYQGLLVTLVSTTIDVMNSWDEVLDIVTLGAAWLRGDPDLADWAGLLNSSVAAAFEDEDFISAWEAGFEGAWGGTALTRGELLGIVNTMPQYVGIIPVRWIAQSWAKYCLIDEINQKLYMTASACQGDTNYSPSGDYSAVGVEQPDGSLMYEVEYDGDDFKIYEYAPDATLSAGVGPGSVWGAPTAWDGRIGVYVDADTTGPSGSINVQAVLGSRQGRLFEAVGQDNLLVGTTLRADATGAIDQLHGISWYTQDMLADTSIANGGVKVTYGDHNDSRVVVNKVYIVCEVA